MYISNRHQIKRLPSIFSREVRGGGGRRGYKFHQTSALELR